MPSFALIAEGLTDQLIVERFIEEICGAGVSDLMINPVQPSRDRTDAFTAPHGGWEMVFEFCKKSITDALATNDFVIIQIDTDCGDHPRYGLPLTDGGTPRGYDVLVRDARIILASKIGNDLFLANSDRIIFAIAVHSTECWLLQVLYGDQSTLSCFDRLRKRVAKDGLHLTKNYATYRHVARGIRRKHLTKLVGAENSLGMFLTDLGGLKLS